MPQPVQPPEIPAIIQPINSEKAASLYESSDGTLAPVITPSVSDEGLATPPTPETFTPESSSVVSQQSAALLGSPISVGYPLQPASVAEPNSESFGSSEAGRSQEATVSTPEPSSQHSHFAPHSLPSTSTPSSSSTEIHHDLRPLGRDELTAMSEELEQNSFTDAFNNSETPSITSTNVVDKVDKDSETAIEDSRQYEQAAQFQALAFLPLPLGEEGTEIKRLVTQERGGEVQEYEFTVPTLDTPPSSPDETTVPTPETQPSLPEDNQVEPTPNQGEASPTPQPTVTPETGTPTPDTSGVIELTADQQEYDEQRQVVTAEGNVLLRFRGAVIDADRVQINLPNRIVVAQGNVSLTRGDQILRGDRFEYAFVQDSGTIANASGEIFQPTAGTDLNLSLPNDVAGSLVSDRPLSDRITANQPLQRITNPGGYTFVVGGQRTLDVDELNRPAGSQVQLNRIQSGGEVNRLRFEAERIDFDSKGWRASNIRMTNDPFSPPELEIRANTATLTRISPLQDVIVASRPRLVFDQGPEVPLLRNRYVIDRRPREPGLFNIKIDDDDRGGVYIERTFELINTPQARLRVTPQFLAQKAFFDEGGNLLNPAVYGLKSRIDIAASPRTSVTGIANFTTLDPDEFEDNTRASLRLRQTIGTTLPHTLNLEYSYRDRLFNGSLGFQTVRSSLGAVLTSPPILLGNTGIYLSYQAGAQYINSETDRLDLLDPVRDNNRVNLGRFQGSAALSRSFSIWQGKPLPVTATEGLRYTPAPVVPYVALSTGITGVATAYTNGDTQNSISGSIGLSGQFGHFSKPFLDYTGFNISYAQVIQNGESPFLFDRVVDNQVLYAGISQQIYGPFRAGFQTAYNLDTGKEISTDYFVEYSRRTYNITLRYNPVLGTGSFSFRINDLNWEGGTEAFSGFGIRPVLQGVPRYTE